MILTKEFKQYIKFINNPIFSLPFFERLGWKKEDANKEADIIYDLMKLFTFTSKDCSLNIKSSLNEKEIKEGEIKRFSLKMTNNKFQYLFQGNTESSHLSISVDSRNIPFWEFFEKTLRNSFLYYFLFKIDLFVSEKDGDMLVLGNSVCSVLGINKVYRQHAPITENNEDVYQKEINNVVKKQLLKTKTLVESIKKDLELI